MDTLDGKNWSHKLVEWVVPAPGYVLVDDAGQAGLVYRGCVLAVGSKESRYKPNDVVLFHAVLKAKYNSQPGEKSLAWIVSESDIVGVVLSENKAYWSEEEG